MIIQRPTSGYTFADSNNTPNSLPVNRLILPNSSKAVRQTFAVIFPEFLNELRTHLAQVKIPTRRLAVVKAALPSDGSGLYHPIVGPDPDYPPLDIWFIADADNRAITVIEEWITGVLCPKQTEFGDNDVVTFVVEKYANTNCPDAEAVGRWIFGGCTPQSLDVVDNFTFQENGETYITLRLTVEYAASQYLSDVTARDTNPYGGTVES